MMVSIVDGWLAGKQGLQCSAAISAPTGRPVVARLSSAVHGPLKWAPDLDQLVLSGQVLCVMERSCGSCVQCI
jgi:hypothetical protein